MPQDLIGDPPKIHVQGGSVLDDLGDVAGNALGDRVGGLVRVFDERSLDADKAIDAIDMKERVAKRATMVRAEHKMLMAISTEMPRLT